MSDELVYFRWSVPSRVELVHGGGLRLDGATCTGAFIAPLNDPATPPTAPLDEPDRLLEAFCAKQITEPAAMLEIAQRWGMLGVEPWLVGGRWAEGVAQWRVALAELRDAFLLWHAVDAGDNDYLSGSLPVGDGAREQPRLTVKSGTAIYVGPTQILRIGGPGSSLEPILAPRDRAYRLRAALFVLGNLVNEKLRGLTGLALVIDRDANRTVTRARPESLLGAAWLALARAIDGRREARCCPRCGGWFVANPAAERGHPREYCNATCRVEMSKRKARARQRAAAGERAASIAKTLGQDVATVRRWLKEPSGRGKRSAKKGKR